MSPSTKLELSESSSAGANAPRRGGREAPHDARIQRQEKKPEIIADQTYDPTLQGPKVLTLRRLKNWMYVHTRFK